MLARGGSVDGGDATDRRSCSGDGGGDHGRSSAGAGKPANLVECLHAYGYACVDAETWRVRPLVPTPALHAVIEGHIELCGHTRYLLRCSFKTATPRQFHWRVCRRLLDLRTVLHDGVKRLLGGGGYATLFDGVPFAHKGGVPGTTLRLARWLAALCDGINAGRCPPSVVFMVLQFIDAPKPGLKRAFVQAADVAPSDDVTPTPDDVRSNVAPACNDVTASRNDNTPGDECCELSNIDICILGASPAEEGQPWKAAANASTAVGNQLVAPTLAMVAGALCGNLTLGFLPPDGLERTVAFGPRKPPLGIDFCCTLPLTVRRVFAHAAELGVQPGWVLRTINGNRVEPDAEEHEASAQPPGCSPGIPAHVTAAMMLLLMT
eukprot:NODE_11967_length_1254_cov_6.396628.p1 GENE.NODE_11967_length_1254_cov_6.396628~~NODE_11967_length_1254_cov_6.396628.p1  ORF type:complete len:407 (-),score=117.46 NODE_11967_length_1254_cov_6.396628:32-1165(-)